MPNYCFVLLPLLLFAISPQQQPAATPAVATATATVAAATPAVPTIPVEAARMVNPVRPTPDSRARAKEMYKIDCALCHGENGDGKGDPGVIADMHLSMMDFTDPATLKNRTDGEIFYIIKNGLGKMPGESDRAKTDQMWNLVIYVRSLAKE